MIIDKYTKAAWTILAISLFVISEIGFKTFQPSGSKGFIYVRDKNGCGTVSKTISIIGYDKFFTPNNDNHNDYWRISGINSSTQSGSYVFIFDKYGKLVKQLNPLSRGWDGTFNGIPLPASDYWFRVKLDDGRDFKGHFTLKR